MLSPDNRCLSFALMHVRARRWATCARARRLFSAAGAATGAPRAADRAAFLRSAGSNTSGLTDGSDAPLCLELAVGDYGGLGAPAGFAQLVGTPLNDRERRLLSHCQQLRM